MPFDVTWKQVAKTVCNVGLAITAAAALAGYFSRWFLPGELASHFRLQYAVIFGLGTCLLAAQRSWAWAIVALLLALANAATIVPFYFRQHGAPQRPMAHIAASAGQPTGQVNSPTQARNRPDGATPLRVVSLNVYSANRRHAEVTRFLRGAAADLVVLLEVTDAWSDVFAALADDYPYREVHPRDDNFGIALFSRLPFDSVALVDFGGAGPQSIVAHYQIADESLIVIATHPLPPISSTYWRARNDQLAALATFVRRQAGAVIVLGDLNITSGSAYFDLLLEGTWLRDSRQGFGWQPSWPAWFAPARIPIDHVLVTPEIEIIDRRIGPNVGSDHLPVIVDCRLRHSDKR